MTKSHISKPTISINVKNSLIMIHKNTLRLLGNPEYIQILVNPAEKTIVLCRSFESDHLAHHVNKDIFTEARKSLKICSCALTNNLHKINPVWVKNKTYRMAGEFITHLNIIKFRMNSTLAVTDRNRRSYNE